MQSDLKALEKRLPTARWEVVDFTFTTNDADHQLPHSLDPADPYDVKFEVIDQNVGGVVYRGNKAPSSNYIILRASIAGTYRIRLFVEAYPTNSPRATTTSSTASSGPVGLAPTRGDIIYANSTPAWVKLAVGTGFLKANGTDVSGWVQVTETDINPYGRPALGRLTLVSGDAIGDATGAGTIYYTPFVGDIIPLYDGAKWVNYTFSEFSLALSGLTSGKPYDVFAYANAGVPTLEFLVWTNDTARATAVVRQDGVWVKSGAPTRRLLGTFYTVSTTTTTDDPSFRYLHNVENRITKYLINPGTAGWDYGTATTRVANNSFSNAVFIVASVTPDAIHLNLNVTWSHSAVENYMAFGIGYDSQTNYMTGFAGAASQLDHDGNDVNDIKNSYASGTYTPAVGRHYFAWLEYSSGANGHVYSDRSTVYNYSGLNATWRC